MPLPCHPGRRRITGLVLLLASGCTSGPPTPSATLPPDAVQGAGDPTRAAILTTASVFGSPGSIAGQPAVAARAAAQLEYLVVEIATGPRWWGFSPNVSLELQKARPELRAALGIAPTAPPQAIIDSLYAVSRALTAGDQAAVEGILVPPLYPAGPAVTLQRLYALPFLPQANFATALAARELNWLDDGGGRRGFGGFRF